MNSFTIRDVENLTGIKAHTIRIWEQRYSFLKPGRSNTNIRYYSGEELKIILNIALLNKFGYKISHIDKMSEPEVQDKIRKLTISEADLEKTISELIAAVIDLDMEHFQQVLTQFITRSGIQKTINQVVFPFLERIGILWVTNNINPAQEHLVTNIIRQKLIVAIENIDIAVREQKLGLLFLPEGEYHELGLLYMYYLVKSRGYNILYLGANVPVKDLEYITERKKPQFLYTHITAAAGSFHFDRYLNQLHEVVAGVPVVISGQVARQHQKPVPDNIYLQTSLQDVLQCLTNL